jgi:Flp pilus assembly protein TadG
MMWYLSSRRRQSGQILPIAAAAFLVMCALAGLAIDSSRDYLVKRGAQNAVDFAVLAAAKQMTLLGSINSPIAPTSLAVQAVHDFAWNNGFNTISSHACDVSSGTSFTTTWFDVAGPACTATTGFTNKVTVNSPPVALPGNPVPLACLGTGKYSCVQAVITTQIAELFTAVLGIRFAYVTVAASAQAALPASAFDAPPPNALTLYQPTSKQAGCDSGDQQCFDELRAANRTGLSCGGTNNCPTLWIQSGAASEFDGYDGSVFTPSQDLTAVQSAGDMLIQAPTTFCDSYNGGTCAMNTAKGAAGFAVPASAKLYCSAFGAGAGTTPCTNVPVQAPPDKIYGNQTAWGSPFSWFPTVSTTGEATNCGGLILNGGVVTGPCAKAGEDYVIQPGVYSYIVINHGAYEFNAGLFDITGTAPVNTLSSGFANGIDHRNENALNDFDLCTAGTPTGCGGVTPLSAGVWFGHGGGSYGAYVNPTPAVCNSNQPGSDGGGGDATVISGSGVVFRLEATAQNPLFPSGGFVSTNEVTSLALAGNSIGGLQVNSSQGNVNGTPLLIDEENNAFIHIDAATPQYGNGSNTISGIVYQTASATGGGFEIDLGMNGNLQTPIQGQILAYSFTSFGAGGQMDFTGGYGTASVPTIQTSGKSEPQIISSVSLTAAVGQTNYSTLTVNYTDEWMMDGFDTYVKVNNASPQFFSQGIWTTVPGPNAPLPPPANNPGDQFAAYHTASNHGSYTISGSDPTDWTFAIPNSNGATIETKGQWSWGHQTDIAGAIRGTYTAKMLYTFPNPTGSYLSITLFALDGDHCGDYAYSTYTFKNTGLPGPGSQSIGSVGLVQ